MPSHDEIQRIATAMNAARPDWKPSSLVTFLTRHHAARSYRDLLIAGIVVASDARTETPRLLNQHGPWWVAAQAAQPDRASTTVPGVHTIRCDVPGHEHELATNCRACRSERLGRDENRTDTLAMPDAQLATNIRGAALVRQALTHNPAPTPIDGRSLAAGEREDD